MNLSMFCFALLLLHSCIPIEALPQTKPRTPTTSWTALPQTLTCTSLVGRTPQPTCTTYTTYGTDVTWTVTTKTANIVSNTMSVPIPAAPATVLAVIESGTTLWPMPTLTVEKNQRIRITLYNSLPEEDVTLHFHGLVQNHGYVSMDGPEGVTQCGLSSKGPFIYDFVASKAGTYWIHSHDPGQYPKGLRSPLIVHDPADKSTYAGDFTATLSDWYPDFWWAEEQYLNSPVPAKPCGSGIEIEPNATIFNDFVPGLTNEDRVKPYVLQQGGKKYRLRFVNMSAFTPFLVKIIGHVVQLIEIDGIELDPTSSAETEGFIIAPGQRVSALLTSLTSSTETFSIIAVLDPSVAGGKLESKFPAECHTTPRDKSNINGVMYTWGCVTYSSDVTKCPLPPSSDAILQVYREDDEEVKKRPRLKNKLKIDWKDFTHTSVAYPWDNNERILVPLDKTGTDRTTLLNPEPGNVHWIQIIDVQARTDPKDREFGSMDNALWEAPSLPALVSALNAPLTSSELNDPSTYGRSTNTFVVPSLESVSPQSPAVWLVFNTTQGDHPMHLHGHHVSLLYKGAEAPYQINAFKAAIDIFNTEQNGKDSPEWKTFRAAVDQQAAAYPMQRDTIMAEKFQFLIVAFQADNPGVWALHCHNDFHARSGMFRQIVERPTELRSQLGTWSRTNGDVTFQPGRVTDSTVLQGIERNVQQCLLG